MSDPENIRPMRKKNPPPNNTNTNNKATLSWPPLLLRECCQKSSSSHRPTALQILNECQTKEDLDGVEAFSIRLLQEVRARASTALTTQERTTPLPPKSVLIQRAKELTTPYGGYYLPEKTKNHHHHAEQGENLFHVLTSLLQPAVDNSPAAISMNHHNNHNNTATRSAKALWSADIADRLLWAKQAWENPGRLPRSKESLTEWVDTWCLPFSLQEEQWMLLLDPQDFMTVQLSGEHQENTVLDWLASNHWEWLQSKLVQALRAWRMEAMFPSLSNQLVQHHWKPNSISAAHQGYVVVMQCLVFIARVHCTMVALERDALESPTLLAKILRCADLLSKEVAKVIEAFDVSVLYPSLTERRKTTKKRALASPADEECHADAPATKVARISSSIAASTVDENLQEGQDRSDVASQQSNTPSRKPLRTEGILNTAAAAPSQERKKRTKNPLAGDPFAVGFRDTHKIRNDDFLRLFPVEQLDLKTGQVMKTFPSGFVALLSTTPEDHDVSSSHIQRFHSAVLGRLQRNGRSQGHCFQKSFWRMCGSNASPNDYLPKTTRRRKADKRTRRQKADGDARSYLLSAMDPFVRLKFEKGSTTRKAIFTGYPVEQLDPRTGHILASFDSGSEAADSVFPGLQNTFSLQNSLFGYRCHPTTGKFHGHMYKGYFWRFKGSTAKPGDPSRVSTHPVVHSGPNVQGTRGNLPDSVRPEDTADAFHGKTDTCSALSSDGAATSPDQGKQDAQTINDIGESDDNDESDKPTSSGNNVHDDDDDSDDDSTNFDDEDDGWYADV